MNLINKLKNKRIAVCDGDCLKCEHANPIYNRVFYCDKYDQFVSLKHRKYFIVDKRSKEWNKMKYASDSKWVKK